MARVRNKSGGGEGSTPIKSDVARIRGISALLIRRLERALETNDMQALTALIGSPAKTTNALSVLYRLVDQLDQNRAQIEADQPLGASDYQILLDACLSFEVKKRGGNLNDLERIRLACHEAISQTMN